MPYNNEWVPNDLLLEHNGVRIFHTYKHDEDMVNLYWYGTASDTSEEGEDETCFDVRTLPARISRKSAGSVLNINQIIMAAIDEGYLDQQIKAAEERPKETLAEYEKRLVDELVIEKLSPMLLNLRETAIRRILDLNGRKGLLIPFLEIEGYFLNTDASYVKAYLDSRPCEDILKMLLQMEDRIIGNGNGE